MIPRLALCAYKILTAVLLPFFVRLLVKKRHRDPPYGEEGLAQLYGKSLPGLEASVIFHGASLGEVMAARPLIRLFAERHPEITTVVSTRTTTGMGAAQSLPGTHVYMPLDAPQAMRRFFRALKPRVLVIIDTELWPGMLDAARSAHCAVIITNARIRDRHLEQYLKCPRLARALLAAPISGVMARSAHDAENFAALGVPSERIMSGGNLKYDLTPRADLFAEGRMIRHQIGPCPVLGALSTHGEESLALVRVWHALRTEFPTLSLVLVPRHHADVGELLARLDVLRLPWCQRTDRDDPMPVFTGRILIGDTMGEMERYIGLCDVVFMGGSLVDIGGHNPLEPASFGVAVVSGPSIQNFAEEYAGLTACQAAVIGNNEEEITQALGELLRHPETTADRAARARDIIAQGRGAVNRTIMQIEALLG